MGVSTVTEKGQATIPKALREKHGIRRKVLMVDTQDGILLKPIPDPSMERGSLKPLFGSATARELIKEARADEVEQTSRAPGRHRRR
ncbi:MAG: AbrB/MazE/SpoVT family DNA-binding domain-containing protein [Nitrososphaerota archaeon]|nr:AbrB/MazE/SpoVT family DNA-binding domain-containing protein [Nitrososphaerota archaeon]